MSLNLPEPSETIDVWGNQLNEAIETVNAKAEAAQAEVDALEAVVSGEEGEGSGFVLESSIGAASGVAPLDSAKQVPFQHLGRIGPAEIGAAFASHQHNAGDLPNVALALDASPAFAMFNPTTQQWPLRTSITTSLTRTVIWWGDADIPTYAIPGVDLYYGPRSSGAKIPDPIDPTPPTGDIDANGVTLDIPAVVVNGSLYNLTALVHVNAPKTFTYLQIAVRGPNGEQQDTAFNNDASVATTLTLTGSGSAGATGTWRAYLAYNITGGSSQSDWMDGPEVTFEIASTGGGGGGGGSGAVPLIGRSGLPWNDGIFYEGGTVTSANAFAAWRNRPLDAIMYFVGRQNWNEMLWMRDDLTDWPGYRIVSIPSQPSNMNNSTTAAGQNNQWWRDYGTLMKNKGWNDGRTIIRLNWEGNGDWNPYAYNKPNAGSFVQAYKNVVDSIRATAPNTIFDLTVNKDNRISGVNWQTQIFLPLIDHFDIAGLDWYSHGPAQFSQGQFDQAANQDPGGESVAAFCRANDKKMWLQEWAVSRGDPSAGYPGTGDDPNWYDKSWVWFHNNLDVLAGVTTYNDPGAPDIFMHSLFNPTQNPNAAARYKQSDRWGR